MSVGLVTVCCLGQPVRWLACRLHHEKELDFSEAGTLLCPTEGKGLFMSLFSGPEVAQNWGAATLSPLFSPLGA